MAAVEEICRLVKDNKLDAAGKLALEKWSRLITLETPERQALVTSLHPQEQSIIWIAIIAAELDQPELDWTSIIRHMSTFAANFNSDQVHVVPSLFCQLFHHFSQLLCVNRKAIVGIAIVREAVRRYPPNNHTLTAIHSDLIQLCLAARCLKPCLPFLEQDYTSLLTEHGQFDSQHVVQFFYYGGMVYTCLHDYLRAMQLFTICLCVPAVAVSAVMLAAYKKYILVSLLRNGKLVPIPRCAAHLVEKVFKNSCAPYLELARAYTSRDHPSVRKITASFVECFVTDGNYGLVQRVEKQLVHHAVQRLTMSFMKLPLEDAAHRVDLNGPGEIEKMIRDMIEDREVMASINQTQARVEFHDSRVSSTSDGLNVKVLEERLKECIYLQEQLSQANRHLALDTRYIQKSGMHGGGIEEDPLTEDHLM